MKFGVREICDVVFKAKSDVRIGNRIFKKGQPVLYIDTAKTSTVEGAATTVYATGGKGNTRLIAWEGEKTLTFTVEDALLSPMGFAILSGAGLLKGGTEDVVHVHATSVAYTSEGEIDLTDALGTLEKICPTAPIFVSIAEEDGSITGELVENLSVDRTGKKLIGDVSAGKTVFVDYYVQKPSGNVSELQIDAENFAGFYYVEASTLFRRQNDGVDMPAELTLPNVKIQSNFTFTMASTGDPSTFTFTMDAFPGYTYFNPTRKVLCAIQIVEDVENAAKNIETIFPHNDDEVLIESEEDSVPIGADAMNPFMPYESVGYGNKMLSDLGSVKFTWKDGVATATGTTNSVDWGDAGPKTGNSYAVRFAEDILGKPFELFKKSSKDALWGQASNSTSAAGQDELFWVLNIDDNKYFKFTSGGKTIAVFDFSEVKTMATS